MELRDYSVQNVWWKGKEYIKSDKHIKDYSEKKYRWVPEILKEAELVPGNIYTLRGPRQVGKTTLVKSIVKSLLAKNVPEKSIFYATCDALINRDELLKLIRAYLRFKEINNIDKAYIFLDEVSDIADWQKTVKLLVDGGELNNSCLFLTGSHTLDIKYGSEMLPGRTGSQGKDYLLLPLTFREFIQLIKPEIYQKLKAVRTLSVNEFSTCVNSAIPYDRELNVLFSQYMMVGGFMLPINVYFTGNEIPEYVSEIYNRWVVGDITKWGKQEKILKQILRTAIQKQGTALSWNSFAKDAEIKSHRTVSSYIEDLENMYVLFIQYFIDLNRKIPDYSKNKKIYFFDPFIYHLFNRIFYFKDSEITPSLVESVAVVHFARFFLKQCMPAGRSFSDFVYYWKNKKETDIIVKTEESILAAEVKYQNEIKKHDFASLYHFGKGVIISKDTLIHDDKYPVIPVHLVLSLL